MHSCMGKTESRKKEHSFVVNRRQKNKPDKPIRTCGKHVERRPFWYATTIKTKPDHRTGQTTDQTIEQTGQDTEQTGLNQAETIQEWIIFRKRCSLGLFFSGL